jgi:hypothetical protein
MFIAVNANERPSPFGGADGRVAFYQSSSFPLLRTEKGVLPVQSINMSPLTGRRQER